MESNGKVLLMPNDDIEQQCIERKVIQMFIYNETLSRQCHGREGH